MKEFLGLKIAKMMKIFDGLKDGNASDRLKPGLHEPTTIAS